MLPWKSHGMPMEAVCSHESPTEFPWKHHGNPVEVPWTHHGSTTEEPWKTRRKHWKSQDGPEAPWKHLGSTMEAPMDAQCLGLSMVLPRCCHNDFHGTSIEAQRFHLASMALP